MSGLNKVILIGRVGKAPEVRSIDNGSKVGSFSIATSESFKDKTTGEKKEATEWHNIVVWRGLADIAERYVKKRDLIYIEGKIKTRTWEKDNVTRYITEIIADNLTMLGGKNNNTSGNTNGNVVAQSRNSVGTDTSDDLPF